MRVQAIDSLKTDRTARSEPSVVESADHPTLFKRTITTVAKENYDQYIQETIDNITKQGERVLKRADLTEMHKYREMIRGLLNETVSNSFEFSKFARFDSRGRSKVFALVQKVNKRLDDMTQQLLSEEVDKIKLLADMDDIRGLLVDIFM